MKLSSMGVNRKNFKTQRRLGTELPGLGKPGALVRRPYPPGESGNKRKKYSDFALRLEEKQKLRLNYILKEKQLRRFIRDSKKGQAGNWVQNLASRLERRLDNLVFRLGFAPSLKAARQLVGHGHILVNDKKVDIPSCVLTEGDQISIKPSSLKNQAILQGMEKPRLELADYLRKEKKGEQPVGVLQSTPGLEHIPFSFDSGLFTEYYAARKT